MSQHKEVLVSYQDNEAYIDALIAPLIFEMWKAGIQTESSCQNVDNKIWIHFPDVENAQNFLNIVGSVHEKSRYSLYSRLTDYYYPERNHRAQAKFWEYHTQVSDASMVRGDSPTQDERVGRPRFYFFMIILFPKSDLPTVFERFLNHNAEVNEDVVKR